MPMPKYYCDYCDKQFQDTPSARRRHLQGLQHQRARKLWYDSFQDPHQLQLQLQQDNLGKGVCAHFVKTGFCQYGDNCKYFHPIQNVQQAAIFSGASSANAQATVADSVQSANVPEKLQLEAPVRKDLAAEKLAISLINLPPSLRPPPEGGYSSFPFIDWG